MRWMPRTCPSMRRSRFWTAALLSLYPTMAIMIPPRGISRVHDLPDCVPVAAGVLELLLPSGESARTFAPTLSEHLAIVDRDGARSTRTDRTYLDTFDGRLHGRGWRLYVHK